jgi:methyltransferase
VPAFPLAVYLVALLIERLAEMWLSRRNLARLAARGAVERGAGHFWMFVALHVLYPVLLVSEILRDGARPPAAWPAWLAAWLVAQALRVTAVRTLGERWNVRIVVLPGQAPVSSGIYRWIPHPNYLAVAIEFVAAPLMFGAWRTAVICTVLNALAMTVRIPAEVRALREAAGEAPTHK